MSRYLVEQTARALRDRAVEAAASGSAFPTESELVKELELSRTTVREAISRLEAEGFVKRRHGTATAINTAAIEIGGLVNGDGIESRLATSAATLREVAPCLLEQSVAEELRAAVGHPARRTVRTWAVDGSPVVAVIEHLLLPTWPMTIEPPDGPIETLVETIYGELVQWQVTTTDAEASDEHCAGLLAIEVGSPVLVSNGVFITSTDRRVAHARTYSRPGANPIPSVTTFPDRAPGR
ncbi:MAG: GntR family transcriptional regulator [bacterium]|nr:GntR family transcriptional regulator [bacterium]